MIIRNLFQIPIHWGGHAKTNKHVQMRTWQAHIRLIAQPCAPSNPLSEHISNLQFFLCKSHTTKHIANHSQALYILFFSRRYNLQPMAGSKGTCPPRIRICKLSLGEVALDRCKNIFLSPKRKSRWHSLAPHPKAKTAPTKASEFFLLGKSYQPICKQPTYSP